MRKMMNTILSILLCGCAFTSVAQETTSDVTGIVTENQKPIAGATVTALHVPSGTKYATTTRNDGRYNLANLKVGGPYTITVSFVGYKEEKQENVQLLLGQEFKADFVLTPESGVLENVVVTSARQDKVFNNSHTGSQEVISRTQLERLPTINVLCRILQNLHPLQMV